MKIKELIDMLQKLDQEKQIKVVDVTWNIYGRTNEEINIELYNKNSGIEDWSDNKDFYVIN